jgi:hypothetical protein
VLCKHKKVSEIEKQASREMPYEIARVLFVMSEFSNKQRVSSVEEALEFAESETQNLMRALNSFGSPQIPSKILSLSASLTNANEIPSQSPTILQVSHTSLSMKVLFGWRFWKKTTKESLGDGKNSIFNLLVFA